MPVPAFTDLGKVAKGVLYNGSTLNGNRAYDQVATISTTAVDGVSFTAAVVKKAEVVEPSIKAAWKNKEYALLGTFLPNGKVTATAAWANAAPGLKLSATGTLPDTSTLKVIADYTVPHLTLKTTLGSFASTAEKEAHPTVEVAATTGYKDITLGVAGLFNYEKQTITAWTAAAGYVARDFVVSGHFSEDQKLRVTYAHIVNSTFSAAGEVEKVLGSEDTTISVGFAKDLVGGSSAKARVDSRGIASLLYESNLQPGVRLALTGQYNLLSGAASPKIGVALDIKGP